MLQTFAAKTLNIRRAIFVLILGLIIAFLHDIPAFSPKSPIPPSSEVLSEKTTDSELASAVLGSLNIKGRAPKTGYARSEFGDGWARASGCDVRNLMLSRGLVDIEYANDGCKVLSGVLHDPYTGNTFEFVRGVATSAEVQIDHVVSLSDSWQKGAQALDISVRIQFANDPLNLLAVNGNSNQQKADSDAASWLPTNKNYRCSFVARQIAVKSKYGLWVTQAEKAAIDRVLSSCPDQLIPTE